MKCTMENYQEKNRQRSPVIVIASGKGGTGKTTVATGLAKVMDKDSVTLLDCDVEEPNCHIFLNPDTTDQQIYSTFIPVVDEDRCDYCGKCSELCQFNAIINLNTTMLVFPELCHSCEGCEKICPKQAITAGNKEIGSIMKGKSGNVTLIYGNLKIGEAQSPPLIKEVKRLGLSKRSASYIVIDAPPGTSCPVIEAVKESDFVLLVTEPTPFGLHDLKLAVEMVRTLGIEFAVLINRSTIGDRTVWEYCEAQNIEIIAEIPDDKNIATAYSRGEMLPDVSPEYKKTFEIFSVRLKKRVMEVAQV